MKHFLLLIATCAHMAGQDIDLTGYSLAFEDNFDELSVSPNGSELKGDKTWYHLPPYGPQGSYSVSAWTSDAMWAVSDGILPIDAFWWEPNQTWYSGQISSMDKAGAGFAQKYGYFSARMKMPNAGTGAWPSFWLLTQNSIPNNQGSRLEIDIFEWYGKDHFAAGSVGNTLHCWNGDGSQGAGSGGKWGDIPGGDAIGTWHIYGVLVKPDFITWYIDGVQTFQLPTPGEYLQYPLYIMIAYALGGGWPISGEPFASKGKSSLLVDWVRVYSFIEAPQHLRAL